VIFPIITSQIHPITPPFIRRFGTYKFIEKGDEDYEAF